MDEEKIKRIKDDFQFLIKEQNIHSILVFGSYAGEDETARSDIDICIIMPENRELGERLLNIAISKLSSKGYDIHLFETLPLYIKIEIINNHQVIHSKDIYDLYEYFYFYRKIWKDQEHRQKLTKEEMLKLFS